jgi:hypothetical protein
MTAEETKKWLDGELARAADPKRGEPDCYVMFRTRPHRFGPGDEIVGMPLAIFRSRAALYENFARIADKVDSKFGISAAVWWFDDEGRF